MALLDVGRDAGATVRRNPSALFVAASVLLAAALLPRMTVLLGVVTGQANGEQLLWAVGAAQFLALLLVGAGDLLVLRMLGTGEGVRAAGSSLGHSRATMLVWATAAAVGLVPLAVGSLTVGPVASVIALLRPKLFFAVPLAALAVFLPLFALTYYVPVVAALDGRRLDDCLRANAALLLRSPRPTIGAVLLGTAAVGIAACALVVGAGLTLVGIALGWLLVPILLLLPGLPLILLGLVGVPTAYVFARALAVRTYERAVES